MSQHQIIAGVSKLGAPNSYRPRPHEAKVGSSQLLKIGGAP